LLYRLQPGERAECAVTKVLPPVSFMRQSTGTATALQLRALGTTPGRPVRTEAAPPPFESRHFLSPNYAVEIRRGLQRA